jgi:organic radical activating enzyme
MENAVHTETAPSGREAPPGGALPLMEMFPTLQGEGYHTGRPAFFIRLGGCDIGCVWCDVKESWDAGRHPAIAVGDMVREAQRHETRFAVITGGEPCHYDLRALCGALRGAGFETALETSGAYPVRGEFDWVCVSPKKFRFPLQESLRRADEMKVVVHHPSDLRWAEQNAAGVRPDCRRYLQPEYGKAAAMLPLIVEFVQAHPGWRVSLQTHKLLGIP